MIPRFLSGLSFVMVVCGVHGLALGQEAEDVHTIQLEKRIAKATGKGLVWLVASQQEDGSWGSGRFEGSVAVTAQCLLAVLGSGSTPASGPDTVAARRAAMWLLDQSNDNGLIARNEAAAHGPMYGHAFATLALSESFGEVSSDKAQRVLRAAATLIQETQNDDGGWRYKPTPGDADLSVTSAMLIALRSLSAAGVAVQEEVPQKAIAYITRLQNEDGGFRYLLEAGPSGAPRTAAALFALQLAGAEGVVIDNGFRWLNQHPLRLNSDDGYALYGLSYSAAARYQRLLSTHAKNAWEKWYSRATRMLLEAQRTNGSWSDPSCSEYGTAAAISVLQMPNGLLPIVVEQGRMKNQVGP
jgi:prenyltransferase beta subunit